MIASVDPISSGFVITDPEDPRYQYLLGVKHRFGRFLHSASVSLRQQGEENTVDAVQMLVCLFHPVLSPTCTQHVQVRSVRTYMLEYGDSQDRYVSFVCYLWRKNESWYSYYNNEDQYTNDKSVARQYGGQKVWPRAVYVRRARFVFYLCRAHLLTVGPDIIMQHAYAGTALNVKGVKSKISSSMTWLNGQYGIMPLYASKLRCLSASPHY
jgi:hypothetical protein